jgi:hypothetical protein
MAVFHTWCRSMRATGNLKPAYDIIHLLYLEHVRGSRTGVSERNHDRSPSTYMISPMLNAYHSTTAVSKRKLLAPPLAAEDTQVHG